MSHRLRFASSSVGTKILIGFTGLALFGFLVVHLAGNLLVMVSAESFNQYSHALITNPLIYAAEAGLAALFLLHVIKAVSNYASNRAARPVAYREKKWAGHTSRKTVSSTTMIVTGVIILVFTVTHLKTFKFGAWYAAPGEPEVRDLHRLVLEVFQSPVYVVFYVLCMALIFMHLRHGLSSALQSLGVHHPRYQTLILRTGAVLAALIGSGFALIPVWVYVTGGRP